MTLSSVVLFWAATYWNNPLSSISNLFKLEVSPSPLLIMLKPDMEGSDCMCLKIKPDIQVWRDQDQDADAGKDRRREEKGTTEDEMVGWHHWLAGREFE